MKWISVKDGLPPQDTPVLVYQPNDKSHLELFVISHDGDNWREYDLHEPDTMYQSLTWYDEIKYWMPLPEKPNNNK